MGRFDKRLAIVHRVGKNCNVSRRSSSGYVAIYFWTDCKSSSDTEKALLLGARLPPLWNAHKSKPDKTHKGGFVKITSGDRNIICVFCVSVKAVRASRGLCV